MSSSDDDSGGPAAPRPEDPAATDGGDDMVLTKSVAKTNKQEKQRAKEDKAKHKADLKARAKAEKAKAKADKANQPLTAAQLAKREKAEQNARAKAEKERRKGMSREELDEEAARLTHQRDELEMREEQRADERESVCAMALEDDLSRVQEEVLRRYMVLVDRHDAQVTQARADGARARFERLQRREEGFEYAAAQVVGFTKWKTSVAIHHSYEGHAGAVHAARITQDGELLLSCSEDGTAKLWERQSGNCVCVFIGHTRGVRGGCFSPQFSAHTPGRVATIGFDRTLRVWDGRTGQELHRLDCEHMMYACQWAPDGRTIVTATEDGAVAVWNPDHTKPNLPADKALLFEFRGGHRRGGYEHPVAGVTFSPRGRYLITWGSAGDQRINLWLASHAEQALPQPEEASACDRRLAELQCAVCGCLCTAHAALDGEDGDDGGNSVIAREEAELVKLQKLLDGEGSDDEGGEEEEEEGGAAAKAAKPGSRKKLYIAHGVAIEMKQTLGKLDLEWDTVPAAVDPFNVRRGKYQKAAVCDEDDETLVLEEAISCDGFVRKGPRPEPWSNERFPFDDDVLNDLAEPTAMSASEVVSRNRRSGGRGEERRKLSSAISKLTAISAFGAATAFAKEAAGLGSQQRAVQYSGLAIAGGTSMVALEGDGEVGARASLVSVVPQFGLPELSAPHLQPIKAQSKKPDTTEATHNSTAAAAAAAVEGMRDEEERREVKLEAWLEAAKREFAAPEESESDEEPVVIGHGHHNKEATTAERQAKADADELARVRAEARRAAQVRGEVGKEKWEAAKRAWQEIMALNALELEIQLEKDAMMRFVAFEEFRRREQEKEDAKARRREGLSGADLLVAEMEEAARARAERRGRAAAPLTAEQIYEMWNARELARTGGVAPTKRNMLAALSIADVAEMQQRKEALIAAEAKGTAGRLNPVTLRPDRRAGYTALPGLSATSEARNLGTEGEAAIITNDRASTAAVLATTEANGNAEPGRIYGWRRRRGEPFLPGLAVNEWADPRYAQQRAENRRAHRKGGHVRTFVHLPKRSRAEPMHGHSRWVNQCEFSFDERRIASAGSDGAVKLWDPVSGKLVAQMQVRYL